MDFNILYDEIEQEGVYLFENEMKQQLLDFIPIRYSQKKVLHYCWENLKQSHMLKIKVKPTDEFYSIICKKVPYMKNQVFFAIDGDCLDGEDELMLIEGEKLRHLLEKYYWELDEIYICDLKFTWLFAVNHVFEVFVVGNELIEFIKDCMKDKNCQSLIISCNEYNL